MSMSSVCPQGIDAENVFNFFRSLVALFVLAPSILSSTRLISRWSARTETFFGADFFLVAGFFDMNSSSRLFAESIHSVLPAPQLIGFGRLA